MYKRNVWMFSQMHKNLYAKYYYTVQATKEHNSAN